MKTKFGNATINNCYYKITSRKEGNHLKYLHRLIWEDFYRSELPKGFTIHHKDENTLNNCIMNLQLVRHSEHTTHHKTGEKHHNYGKTHSEQTRKKISEARNTTGYFRVSRMKKNTKQGFIYRYMYYENGKHKVIYSVDIKKLEQKVKAKGLEWIKLSDMEN